MTPRHGPAWFGRVLAVALLYALAGRAGLEVPYFGAFVTLVWLPTGIAVAALYRWGYSTWPGVALGAFAVNLWVGGMPAVAAGIAVGNTLGPLLAAWTLRRLRFDPSFAQRRDVVAFATVALAAMLVPPSGGVPTLLAAGIVTPPDFGAAWLTWWLGDLMGLLLAGPALLTLSRRRLAALVRSPLEFAVLLGLAAPVAVGVFLAPPSYPLPPPLVLVPFVVVAWAALRFGVLGTALTTLGLASAAAFGVARGLGPFQVGDVAGGLRMLWSYIAALVVLGLLLTALLGERRSAERALRLQERRYQRLFDLNPQPMWVHDAETNRFLAVNAAAVAGYGYSRDEFRGMTLDELSAGGALRGRALHRRRDGAELEVELTSQPIEFQGRRARLVMAQDVTERRRLERAVTEATDRERRRLSIELHDGLGQELAGLSMLAQALANDARRQGSPLAPELVQFTALTSGALQSCRRVARGLSPMSDVQGGLVAALSTLVERMQQPDGPAVLLHAPERLPGRLPEAAGEHLLRIAQEAVANAVRHAAADQVELTLEERDAALVLEVVDDGAGLPPVPSTRGIGLETMRYRAEIIGARLTVAQAGERGTRVRCELPLAG